MHRRSHQRMQGTAIFMALLIIAIVAGMASVLMRMQQIDIRRTQMMLTSEQSYLYSQGVIDWAKGALKNDLQNPSATLWPLVLAPTPVGDGVGTISGTLQDAQGLINLNNFRASSSGGYQKKPPSGGINNPNSKIFLSLLTALNVQLNQEQQQQLIAALTMWMSSPPAGTTEVDPYDAQYAQRNPAYRSPHALMASVSELRTVAGMTPVIYTKLLPYIVVLPTSTTFNAGHASLFLQKVARTLNGQTPGGSQQVQPSQYFLLRADVYLQDQHLVLYTILQRNNDPQKFQVTQLWQSFGTI